MEFRSIRVFPCSLYSKIFPILSTDVRSEGKCQSLPKGWKSRTFSSSPSPGFLGEAAPSTLEGVKEEVRDLRAVRIK